jgi:hypothetical protein
MTRLALVAFAIVVGAACRQLLSIDDLDRIDAPVDPSDAEQGDANIVPLDAPEDDAEPPPDAPVDAFVLVCPSGYIDVSGQTSKYRLITLTQSWTSAEADCENDGTGTHLAVISDNNEDNAIDALSAASSQWIGVSDRVNEGTFRNVTGPSTAYFDWATGDPDSGAQGDCVAIIGTRWEDGNCGSLAQAVCECDGVPPDPTSY